MMSEYKRVRGFAALPALAGLAVIAAAAGALVGCAQQGGAGSKGEGTPPGASSSAGRGSPGVQGSVRSWDQYRERAGQRIAQVNADRVYLDTPPDILLAIPVLEIDLNADGSIRRINVLRYPRQARDTTQLAIDAVKRAAPFGDVSNLPKPWRFAETFLYRDDRKFKPRSLD
ncbi:hypothetical protein [Caldimonas brevitalea]|uniref:Uncharacterized protein n=1 Tax=Caldimonas brevitalea TaxID=413882 RepID=A0A0G3BH15_9BURK|nr:hypothetical protein [Caldimonas brevitalea]AKJ28739.1 hypothetical protein AAW51_2048 [Caldimonas brevitalea]